METNVLMSCWGVRTPETQIVQIKQQHRTRGVTVIKAIVTIYERQQRLQKIFFCNEYEYSYRNDLPILLKNKL